MQRCPDCEQVMRGKSCECGYTLPAFKFAQNFKATKCNKCQSSGILHRVVMSGGIDYVAAVRCTCSNGDRLSKSIAITDGNDFTSEQILDRDLKILRERFAREEKAKCSN